MSLPCLRGPPLHSTPSGLVCFSFSFDPLSILHSPNFVDPNRPSTPSLREPGETKTYGLVFSLRTVDRVGSFHSPTLPYQRTNPDGVVEARACKNHPEQTGKQPHCAAVVCAKIFEMKPEQTGKQIHRYAVVCVRIGKTCQQAQ